MAPTLPRLTSGAALSSSSSSSTAGSERNVITLSSSDDAPRLTSGAADVITLSSSDDAPRLTSGAADVITLSSSSDDEQEARSWKGSSSAGSKAGPVVLTSSDSDPDVELLANCRKRRPPRNVAWVFSDEVSILTALADERLESGQLPRAPSALLDAIRRRVQLKRQNPTAGLAKKVRNLKDRFKKVIASGGPSGELRDRELYGLSMKVWPELVPPIVHNSSSSSSSSNGTCSH